MKPVHFKVTLLSDVIINQRAATEGNQSTLDFIPGSSFLGVAASIYNEISSEDSFTLFHSGKVRFGDAHPFVDGKRALKVPASWYKKKDDKEDNKLFVHHGMPKEGLKDKNGNPIQVKQYREDFIINIDKNKVSKVEIKKHFAIKSAYDSAKRRSEDSKMYGYQSLQAGSEWYFEVVIDDDINTELEGKLIQALEGKKRIGRSSTAQYGLVKIKKEEKKLRNGFNVWPEPNARDVDETLVFVYAESRLIFFDKYGQPTFKPEAEQLGFSGGKICWEMSQIRTFQYAPYNNKRQTRDADRCGIEKGSVFCITGTPSSKTENWIGSYQNEGFGKVLINPEFLEYTDDLGKAKCTFIPDPEKENSEKMLSNALITQTNDAPVLSYLKQQKLNKENQQFIYEHVNDFVKNNERNFKGDNFASQWGTIRSMAMQFRNPNTLKEKLYLKSDSYLKHGVAAEKWNERGRLQLFKGFIEDFKDKERLLSEAIINLAAEMAKKFRRD